LIHSLFKSKISAQEQGSPTLLHGPLVARHSSGWASMLEHLKANSTLRVLDIGPTSPNNINFLTGMGHSVCMTDLVQEALTGNYRLPVPEGDSLEEPGWDIESYLNQNLDFSGRTFDVVLLWTTLDYLPRTLVVPVVERLFTRTNPGAKLLMLFHSRNKAEDTFFCRYHLTDSSELLMQETTNYPIVQLFSNRAIEKLYEYYDGYRFYLAKDNVYEVMITR
jgi:hypothetical protein